MERLKRLIQEYYKAEQASNEADTKWEQDPENEELEREFDRTYKAQWELFEALCTEIVCLTEGEIDHKMASYLLRVQRAAIEGLICQKGLVGKI